VFRSLFIIGESTGQRLAEERANVPLNRIKIDDLGGFVEDVGQVHRCRKYAGCSIADRFEVFVGVSRGFSCRMRKWRSGKPLAIW
jgi:hypothetical protein